jgi:DNA invertase Pin-like site-specific DNA recombinase
MLMGYARVSRADQQDTKAQVDALLAAGADRIFEDQASGGRWERPQLHQMIDFLRSEDVVVVWKLDLLSRSLKDLLAIMDLIEAKGAGFRSLTEAIDTTAPAGRMLMQMLGSFAEFEREMIRERTIAGLLAARMRGKVLGRPRKITDEQKEEIVKMVTTGKKTNAEVARLFSVSNTTIGRIVFETSNARTVTDGGCSL